MGSGEGDAPRINYTELMRRTKAVSKFAPKTTIEFNIADFRFCPYCGEYVGVKFSIHKCIYPEID